jgi:hypothetical protein
MQNRTNSPKKRAASLVEFALVLPVFVILITATCDLGRYMFIQATMSHVVRAALRYGVTEQQQTVEVSGTPTTLSVRQSILNFAQSSNPVNELIPIEAGSSTPSSGDTFYIDMATPTSSAWTYARWSSTPSSSSPWEPLSGAVNPVEISGRLLRITFNYKFNYVTPLIGLIGGSNDNSMRISVQTIYQAEAY